MKTKNNRLIIRKNLKKEIKESGISKITPEAVELIIHETEEFISKIIAGAKENMDINARKTLQEKDIAESLKVDEKEFDL